MIEIINHTDFASFFMGLLTGALIVSFLYALIPLYDKKEDEENKDYHSINSTEQKYSIEKKRHSKPPYRP